MHPHIIPQHTQKHLPVVLSATERKRIKEDALRAPAPILPTNIRIFLTLAKKSVCRHLSTGLQAAFGDIRSGYLTPPCIFIENAPIDDELPPTPKDGYWSLEKKTFVSEFFLAGIMQLLGVPFCLQSEKDGKLWSQNIAAEGKESDRSSHGANVKLGFHKELVALTDLGLCCDWLGLICLRQDPLKEAITTVVDVRDVLRSLTPAQIQVLSQPLFQYKIPNSFAANDAFSAPMPLLDGSNPPVMNINFALGMCKIVDDHHEASEAFGHFDHVLETADVVKEFKLEPENVLIINNIWAAHGRSVFKPSYDGFGRWLQRMYVKYDLFLARNRAVAGKILTFDK